MAVAANVLNFTASTTAQVGVLPHPDREQLVIENLGTVDVYYQHPPQVEAANLDISDNYPLLTTSNGFRLKAGRKVTAFGVSAQAAWAFITGSSTASLRIHES